MKPAFFLRVVGLATLAVLAACSRQPQDDPRRPVVENYGSLVYAVYDDALITARALDASIDALLANPSAATLEEARTRWRAARVPYNQSEAFRFYLGPIDREGGPEGRLNGWPLDENHIDAVGNGYNAAPGLNIIGNATLFPEITPELIAEQNEAGGEKNIASGYHAIEFLLWGQDFNQPRTAAGQRAHADFVSASANDTAARRGAYLKAAATLLIRDLETVTAEWRPGSPADAPNYRQRLVTGDVYTGLKRMLTGMVGLSEVEMAGERMSVPLISGDQEEEHSCFSDNTADDLRANVQGIDAVYRGRYQRLDGTVISGPSLADIVAAADPMVGEEMDARLRRMIETMEAINNPFDWEIDPANGEGNARVQAGVDALRNVSLSLGRAATALGIFMSPIESSGD